MIDQASQRQLVELTQLRLSQRTSGDPLTREEIARTVDQLLSAFPEWRERTSRENAVSQLGTLFSTFIGEESVLRDRDDHRPWLDARRESIEWRFWDRYRSYLIRQQIPQPAINSLDRITDRTLELLGNPLDRASFNRRGMVVGDVQAGKTSNYTGLLCKAADSGYKVIIVLAGLYNNLRSQTQIRLDEGFVGKVSVPIDETTNTVVGVGQIDPSPLVNWATNRTERGDFNRRIMNQFGVHPGGSPLLFVVKKVRSALDSVLAWINATGNSQDQHGRCFVGTALLVIDDEADNASIDTQAQTFSHGRPDPDHEPSKINASIRRILGRFDRTSYVGYTATPFANILIHPDAETGSEFQDLFPRDFIINIPSPENYVGPSRVFGLSLDGDEKESPGLPELIEEITDHAESRSRRETRGWIPPLHKSDHRPVYGGEDRIPPSLERAISCFVLVVAARGARGQEHKHNSMLVHVTRFQAVQQQVVNQIQEYLDSLRNEVRYGGSGVLERLRSLWEGTFVGVTQALELPDCPMICWEDVASRLRSSVEAIRLRQINGSSADVLDYEMHRETGLNVIAVGGDKLARGLTLEGLSISYFLRGSRMYDTLLQMGRWFGYRPGYLDLCRLFTTSDLVDWYEHITLASEELRREFDRMETIRATPREFGLRVRSHPTLTVTSRVKMRHGTTLQVSFAGDVSETTVFSTSPGILGSNFKATADFVSRLGDRFHYTQGPAQARSGGGVHRWNRSHYWTGVPADSVLDFLAQFRTHEDASRASTQILASYIRRQNQLNELTDWNVLLVGGDGKEIVRLGNLNVPAVVRQPKGGYGLDGGAPQTRGMDRFVIRRLLNPRDEGVDIGADSYNAAFAETLANPPKRRRADDSRVPNKPAEMNLRKQRPATTGLLLLYPLAREAEIPGPEGQPIQRRFLEIPHHIIGLGISFSASSRAQTVSYVVNSIYGVEDDGET